MPNTKRFTLAEIKHAQDQIKRIQDEEIQTQLQQLTNIQSFDHKPTDAVLENTIVPGETILAEAAAIQIRVVSEFLSQLKSDHSRSITHIDRIQLLSASSPNLLDLGSAIDGDFLWGESLIPESGRPVTIDQFWDDSLANSIRVAEMTVEFLKQMYLPRLNDVMAFISPETSRVSIIGKQILDVLITQNEFGQIKPTELLMDAEFLGLIPSLLDDGFTPQYIRVAIESLVFYLAEVLELIQLLRDSSSFGVAVMSSHLNRLSRRLDIGIAQISLAIPSLDSIISEITEA